MPPSSVGAPAERRAQIRPADVADEQRVAGQHRVRTVLGADLGVVDTRIEIDSGEWPGVSSTTSRTAPSSTVVAVGHRRERVLGLRRAPRWIVGAGPVAQLQVAGDEVGVEVRQEHVADPAAEPVGVVQVLLDVALGVDDGRVATLWSAIRYEAWARQPR